MEDGLDPPADQPALMILSPEFGRWLTGFREL
jgi:hypothetical protein